MTKKSRIAVRQIKKGDKEYFRKLFELYYQRLFLYARSYLNNDGEAEDVVQEMFIHLWEKRKDLVIFTSISSYLYRAVHNRCIQNLRHKKVVEQYHELQQLRIREAGIMYNRINDFTFSEQQIKEIQDIFTRACNMLPDKTKEIFTLSRKDERSNKEIAGMLGVNIKTVEYHMTKALQTMRNAFRDYFILF